MICKAKVVTTAHFKTAEPAMQVVDLEFARFDLEFGFEAVRLCRTFAGGLQGVTGISSNLITNKALALYYFITLC